MKKNHFKEIIFVIITIVVIINLLSLMSCDNGTNQESNHETVSTADSQPLPSESLTTPQNLSIENTESGILQDYDIESNTIQYNRKDLKFSIEKIDEAKKIYNKNNVVIEFKNAYTSESGDLYFNYSIKNNNNKVLHFDSESAVINDNLNLPVLTYADLEPKESSNQTVLIYKEQLYAFGIKEIKNIKLSIFMDFNDYQNIDAEEKESEKKRDLTDKIDINTIEQMSSPNSKSNLLFDNKSISISFEGFFVDEGNDSTIGDIGLFKVENKMEDLINIDLLNFNGNGNRLDEGEFYGYYGTLPSKTVTYYTFYTPSYDGINTGIIEKIKKFDNLGFIFYIRDSKTYEIYSSQELIINFKKSK